MKSLFKIAALVTCLALSACSESGPPASYLATQQTYEVSFVWHLVNSREEMRLLYQSGGGVIPDDCMATRNRRTHGCMLTGFTAVDGHGVQHVYTYRPRYVDDDATLTLGHEAMHVALGSYHE